jgi:hypothetical protein
MTLSSIAAYQLVSAADRPAAELAIYADLGLTGPGAYAMREPDGRVMVWASAALAEDHDGARVTYRSRRPITDAEWLTVTRLAWIDEYDM